MYTFRKFRGALIAVSTVAALAGVSRTAAADQVIFSPFTIDPNALTGDNGCTTCGGLSTGISADNIIGVYQESTTLTAGSPTTGSFSGTAVGEISSFYTGPSGTTPVASNPGINPVYSAGNYGLYATFTSDGTYSCTLPGCAAGGTDTFVGANGSVTLWLDPTADDTFGATVPSVTDPTSNDIALGTSPLLVDGLGQEIGASNGSYNLTFGAFALTEAGQDYFTFPVPFYMTSILTGNFQNFTPSFSLGPNGLPQATVLTSGSVQDTFSPVPEPASLTLLGVGLLAGYRRLRRKTVL